MAKRAGAYRSEKRKKEVKRQKKQEEKRLRRQGKLAPDAENPETIEEAGEPSGEADEAGEEMPGEGDEELTQ